MRAADPPLLERDAPLERLRAAADRARAGQGGVVLVAATAGMGKSSVLRAFADRLRAGAGEAVGVLRSSGRDLERDFPFATVRRLVEPALASPDVRRRVLVGAAAPVAGWFGPSGPTPLLTMLRALYWTLAGLSQERALVLIVDDVHDADDSSLRFLAHLAQVIADLPILLVLAARPDAWTERAPLVALEPDLDDRIVLEALSGPATADLTRLRLEREPDEAFVAASRRLSGGNPFYLGELLREVASVGAAPSAANAEWIAGLGLPALVRGTLLRVAALPVGTVEVLRAAAVLGDQAALVGVAALAQVPLAQAGAIADRLADAGILAPGTDVSFAHALISAAVLADMRDHERSGLYRRAAHVLHERGAPVHAVVQHLLRCAPAGDAWAAELLRGDGLALLETGESSSAAQVLARALSEAPEAADGELYAGLGLALARAGDRSGITHLTRALELSTGLDERGDRALRLTQSHAWLGEYAAAVAVVDHAARVLAPSDDRRLVARAMAFLYRRYSVAMHDQAVLERAELLGLLEGPLTPGRAALRVVLGSDASHHRPRAEAVALLRPVLDSVLDPGLGPGPGPGPGPGTGPETGLGVLAGLEGQVVLAALEAMLTLELDAEFDLLVGHVAARGLAQGSAIDVVGCAHFRALAAHLRGMPVDAVDDAEHTLASGAWTGWPIGASASHAIASMAHLEQDDGPAAALAADRAEAVSLGAGKPASMVLLARGRLALVGGDAPAALDAFTRAGDLLAPTHSHAPGLLEWAADVVDARLACGDRAGAASFADEQLALARTVAGPRAVARALRCVGVTRGEEASLVEALALLDAAGSHGVERVRVLLELGALQRRAGRPAVARGHLDQAWDLAQRLGATRLGRRVREELRVAGARPRRSFVSGPESLTAGERRVAALAAAGCSNTEIAQQLFVTTKTVEKHLGACYRKLAITARGELAAALGPQA